MSDLEKSVRETALKVEGVVNLDKCHVRKMGFDYYVDLDIIVDGKPSLKPNYPTFTTYPRPGDSTRIQIGIIVSIPIGPHHKIFRSCIPKHRPHDATVDQIGDQRFIEAWRRKTGWHNIETRAPV